MLLELFDKALFGFFVSLNLFFNGLPGGGAILISYVHHVLHSSIDLFCITFGDFDDNLFENIFHMSGVARQSIPSFSLYYSPYANISGL